MKRFAVPSALALLFLGAVVFFMRSTPGDEASESVATTPLLGLAMPPGTSLRFSFALEQEGQIPITPELPMAIAIDLAGELEFVALAETGDERPVLVRLLSLTRSRFQMGENSVLGNEPPVGAEALVVLKHTGSIAELRFAADVTPEQERLLHLLLLESQFDVDAAASWTRTERHGLGLGRFRYARSGARKIERHLEGYEMFGGLEAEDQVDLVVTGRSVLEFAEDLGLASIETEETFKAPTFGGRSSFELRRLEVQQLPPAKWLGRAASFAIARAPGEVKSSSTSLERALIQRVEGLTKEQCLADLVAHEKIGRMPDHDRWLWRASGLLRLHPELAAQMVPLLARTTMSSAGRALILDLLSQVGHAEAQAALRAALLLPQVRSDPEFHLLYQRLSLVADPDDETRAFVQEEFERAQGEQRGIAAYALGSVAGASHRSGHPEEAHALADPLLEELEAEADPEAQVKLLGALGNAGLPEHTDRLVSFAASPHPEVRFQAANSLRKLEGEAATRALVQLSTDAHGAAIQRRAISNLDNRPLDETTLTDLVERVRRGEIAPDARSLMVTLLARYLPDPRARAGLEALLHAPDTMTEVRARIRAILGMP